MADLRQFLVNDVGSVQQTNRELQLAIYNTSTPSVTNGGQCCLWTVPAGISWAVFEVWGGGGDGGGACCCMAHYYGPESGAYAKRRLAVTAGQSFCICAGGSGCCSQPCCGTCGFPSWVRCQSDGTIVNCAAGGCGGCVLCFRTYQGCTGICFGMCKMGCDVGTSDFTQPKIMSQPKASNYCWQNMFEFKSGPTKYKSNLLLGIEHCSTSLTISGCSPFGQPAWPGGPGNSATACGGGCCWGGWGSGGLVVVNYG